MCSVYNPYRLTNQTSKNTIFININDRCMHAHFKIKNNSVYSILKSEDTWEKYSEICYIKKIFMASVF